MWNWLVTLGEASRPFELWIDGECSGSAQFLCPYPSDQSRALLTHCQNFNVKNSPPMDGQFGE